MSKLDELLKSLCPGGIPTKPMWEITYWDKKFKEVDRKKQKKIISYPYLLADELFSLQRDEGNVFLLSTGEKTGWTTEELAGNNLCEGEVVTIPWGKSRPLVEVAKYYSGKFVTADNRIATSADTSILLNKFLYYWMQSKGTTIDGFYRGDGLQHPSMHSVLEMKVPIPPIEIQKEIIRILDDYSDKNNQLIEELRNELSSRKIQYEYYCERAFDIAIPTNDNTTDIKSICVKICSGGTPKTSHSSYYGGDIPWLRTQEVDWDDISDTEIKITEEGLANSSAKLIPANCVIVAMYGATAAKSAINRIPLSTNQACCNLQIDTTITSAEYVFCWLKKEYKKLKALGRGSQDNLNGDMIKNYPIVVPSNDIQNLIVARIDKLTKYYEELYVEIENEIILRKKQYAYYRDKLLTFAESKEG